MSALRFFPSPPKVMEVWVRIEWLAENSNTNTNTPVHTQTHTHTNMHTTPR
jgi:hypothetical protein